ncbi:histidinol-phosphatase [Congzhengia minquanensis]|uniref:Histidinol-phosphatase n=1 Tax=Congzhengia minquanensis TaxID=2763657 RepID=A0A926DQ37_9FIRM|nr:histidinol-phosphatase [Congzhengia minquanensis]MBC8541764.1 histidinol-phosphatase [Congzhengia minquanensis]
MMVTSNFHTHTTYCDGKSTAEETVLAAIEKGMTALGFSGHAYTPFDASYCMSLEDTAKYRAEINRLKQKYAGQIDIYCGLEMDYFSEADTNGFDFLIGSVHYVKKNGAFLSVDGCAFQENVHCGYHGDYYAFAEDYFALVSRVAEKTKADIIGHFDLITKFNEGEKLFSESNPRYEKAWDAALRALIPSGKPFEINTGAMQRGYRSSPYPAVPILKKIQEYGGKIIISSDCHQADAVDFAFDTAIEFAKKSGFQSAYTLAGAPKAPLSLSEFSLARL